jgi:hypothetical protein
VLSHPSPDQRVGQDQALPAHKEFKDNQDQQELLVGQDLQQQDLLVHKVKLVQLVLLDLESQVRLEPHLR